MALNLFWVFRYEIDDFDDCPWSIEANINASSKITSLFSSTHKNINKTLSNYQKVAKISIKSKGLSANDSKSEFNLFFKEEKQN